MIRNANSVRIAIVASSLRLAGAEKQTVYIAQSLHEAGIDVRFYYLGAGGYYENILRESGVPLSQVYEANRPWRILVRLVRAMRQLRPDIVLVTQFGDLLHGATAGRCCGALTLGGIRSDGLRELNARGRLSRWMIRLPHGFIANSYCGTQNVVSRGVQSNKIEVLPNVINLEDFDARTALPVGITLPSNRVVAAAVGTLHTGKRFDRFIQALALARREEPSLAGIIVGGDRGAKAGLEERAKSLGLTAPDLTFVGEFDRIPALLARAAFLVLSSDYEGFPNVILEAMAARLPVITTPAGDAARVVQDGRTGYVIRRDDIEQMATSMVRLAQSPVLRAKLGEEGRKRVEQEYNYGLLSNRVVDIFQRFASRFGRNALADGLETDVPETEPSTELVLEQRIA